MVGFPRTDGVVLVEPEYLKDRKGKEKKVTPTLENGLMLIQSLFLVFTICLL